MKQNDLFLPAHLSPAIEALIERLAAEARAELSQMTEHALRSIGQRTRIDHLLHRIERERDDVLTVRHIRRAVKILLDVRPHRWLFVPPGTKLAPFTISLQPGVRL